MIKAIIFDMDGVLINTEPLHYKVWKMVMEHYDIVLSYQVYETCIGGTFDYLIMTVEREYQTKFSAYNRIKEEFGVIKQEIIEMEGYPVIEGVEEMVKELYEKGYTLAVASSSDMEQIKATVEALGLEPYFQHLVSGTNVPHSKPSPDIFLKTIADLGIEARECMVIEDSTNGIKAARAAGLTCVAYQNRDSGKQEWSLADYAVDEFSEFIDYIEEEQKRC